MTSIMIHNTDDVSAKTHDCRGEYTGEFTTLEIKVYSDDGKFDLTLFGLSPSYARRLAAAINAVRADDDQIEEAA
jgi:hypothetical protein